MWHDSLEKVYFPSGQENLIRRKVKDQMLWGLSRKTLTDKNVDFLCWSDEVILILMLVLGNLGGLKMTGI
jgi:hypothetical protein